MPKIKVNIRYDVYSIKQWDSACGNRGAWVHVLMTKDKHFAYEQLPVYRDRGQQAKVVHPAQWVVDMFVLAGNKIWTRSATGMV